MQMATVISCSSDVIRQALPTISIVRYYYAYKTAELSHDVLPHNIAVPHHNLHNTGSRLVLTFLQTLITFAIIFDKNGFLDELSFHHKNQSKLSICVNSKLDEYGFIPTSNKTEHFSTSTKSHENIKLSYPRL